MTENNARRKKDSRALFEWQIISGPSVNNDFFYVNQSINIQLQYQQLNIRASHFC